KKKKHNQPVPCGVTAANCFKPIKQGYLSFPTEAGVNTNERVMGAQVQFHRQMLTAEKNGKTR
uniref:hypothetical protein n=1 Tax=Cronobacter sakazakii TaxID=28141 RepID=UPI00294B772C